MLFITGGTVSFYFSAIPLATSSWCEAGCRPPDDPRCCARLRPSFDVFRLLAGMRVPGYQQIMAGLQSSLSTDPFLLTVERSPETGYCGLWTPQGCRLPTEARPDPCRYHLCRTTLFEDDPAATAVLDHFDRFCLALTGHEIEHSFLERCARDRFRALHAQRPRAEPFTVFFDALRYLQGDYEEYRTRRQGFVRELLGTDYLTVVVQVNG